MWPWEHLAVGYIAYSLLTRLLYGHAPRGRLTIFALAIGTQFPDLVDKPLAWTFGVLPTGTSLAHSVFFAVPFVVFLLTVTWAAGRPSVGAGFGIGYLLHLPADVLYVGLYGTPISWSVILWPLVEQTGGREAGFLDNFAYYFGNFTELATSSMGTTFIALEVTLLGGALLLWIVDGIPGIRGRERPPRRRPLQN